MAIYDLLRREIVIRIVYDGLPGSGKTTNLHKLLGCLPDRILRRFQSTEPVGSPTQVFDWLELPKLSTRNGRQTVRCQILSVPGQTDLQLRRELILQHADAIVFVCGSQQAEIAESRRMLSEFSRIIPRHERRVVPPGFILQANKQDCDGALKPEEIAAQLGLSETLPVFGATAATGHGVYETLRMAVRLATHRARKLLAVGVIERKSDPVEDPQDYYDRILAAEQTLTKSEVENQALSEFEATLQSFDRSNSTSHPHQQFRQVHSAIGESGSSTLLSDSADKEDGPTRSGPDSEIFTNASAGYDQFHTHYQRTAHLAAPASAPPRTETTDPADPDSPSPGVRQSSQPDQEAAAVFVTPTLGRQQLNQVTSTQVAQAEGEAIQGRAGGTLTQTKTPLAPISQTEPTATGLQQADQIPAHQKAADQEASAQTPSWQQDLRQPQPEPANSGQTDSSWAASGKPAAEGQATATAAGVNQPHRQAETRRAEAEAHQSPTRSGQATTSGDFVASADPLSRASRPDPETLENEAGANALSDRSPSQSMRVSSEASDQAVSEEQTPRGTQKQPEQTSDAADPEFARSANAALLEELLRNAANANSENDQGSSSEESGLSSNVFSVDDEEEPEYRPDLNSLVPGATAENPSQTTAGAQGQPVLRESAASRSSLNTGSSLGTGSSLSAGSSLSMGPSSPEGAPRAPSSPEGAPRAPSTPAGASPFKISSRDLADRTSQPGPHDTVLSSSATTDTTDGASPRVSVSSPRLQTSSVPGTGLALGLSEGELPAIPSTVPEAGNAWPPVVAREILTKLVSIPLGPHQQDHWVALDEDFLEFRGKAGWRLRTRPRLWSFSDRSASRLVLIPIVRLYARVVSILPGEKVLVLVPEAAGYRIWEVTPDLTTVADQIQQLSAAGRRADLRRLIADASEVAERFDAVARENQVSLELVPELIAISPSGAVYLGSLTAAEQEQSSVDHFREAIAQLSSEQSDPKPSGS